jgi:hypothetical protein
MSMDCIRSRGIDRLNLSRVFKHSKLNHGLFFLEITEILLTVALNTITVTLW